MLWPGSQAINVLLRCCKQKLCIQTLPNINKLARGMHVSSCCLVGNSHKNQSNSPTKEQIANHRKTLMAKSLPARKPIEGVKKVVLVASGKGGVGKSTVAANLAVSLKLLYPDKDISLLDADVFGPSLPRMMNLSGEPELHKDDRMIPLQNYGIKCMSMGFLVKESEPVVWRGLMVMSAIEKLVRGVRWGPSDILVVDMPPGTGDTQLSFAQTVVVDGAVIVTTPQQVAFQDAIKGAAMFKKVNIPVLGYVINMSSYSCTQCGSLTKSKYASTIPSLIESQDAVILGEIPFSIDVSDSSDDGRPIVLESSTNIQAKEFKQIAEAVYKRIHTDDAEM